MTSLKLRYGLCFNDLHTHEGLSRLDDYFIEFLNHHNNNLCQSLTAVRTLHDSISSLDESDLITKLSPYLEDFIAEFFNVETSVQELQKRHHDLAPLLTCKRVFIQKKIVHHYTSESVQDFCKEDFKNFISLDDLDFSKQVLKAINERNNDFLKHAEHYAAWRYFAPEASPYKNRSPLFTLPQKIDFQNLFPLEKKEALSVPKTFYKARDGFNLTDQGAPFADAVDQANYCLYCHKREKDSCRQGISRKKLPTDSGQTSSEKPFNENPLGALLTGCPLEQKISEMNQVRQEGYCIGSLAIAMIDNPLLAATGERICNECEKACIFQKQDPVKIPAIETQTLREVLALPWGAEIYSLLTRWNPLNIRSPLPKPNSGYQVLVAGMGPAGFTLAHYLLNEGHSVVGIDGLKIEPLPSAAFKPLHNIQKDLFESLDSRVIGGFGGVAEYGITVRWDKNFLTLIRLILERRQGFKLFGGIRLGSQITPEESLTKGFDHIALCLGAGRPRFLPLKNSFAKGVRMAADFLMGLQLSGAFKKDSFAGLQIRLPSLVIGGGLTAIDTATEVLAYYPRQVETFLKRYENLVAKYGEKVVRQNWTEEEAHIAEDFLIHARALQQERHQARQENRRINFLPLLKEWGGVRILYRKQLTQSPAYRLNHEEVFKALQEGVEFQEETTPQKIQVDQFGAIQSIHINSGEKEEILSARSLFLALGTQPNLTLSKEFPDLFVKDGTTFQALSEEGSPVSPQRLSKPDKIALFISAKGPLENRVSFFGDLHPSFSGSVVKAMASAKRGYSLISRTLLKKPPLSTQKAVFETVKKEWLATVHKVKILGPGIVDVVVRAPAAAKHFKPGQFFRLQNFERSFPHHNYSKRGDLIMEGLALTGASADPESGLISLIILEMGGSSNLCRHLKIGEPVVLMGPTGTGTTLAGDHIVLIGGGLGNAVLFSIGKALRAQGKKILYVAAYKNAESIFKPEALEDAADQIIWTLEKDNLPFTLREQDLFFRGNVIEALLHYQLLLKHQESLLVIGSDGMMQAVQKAVSGPLQKALESCKTFIASINSPMQCMMKEICAQCLQVHKDPVTGEENVVFSCTNQDQPLKKVDFNMLKNRLSQNSLQEKLGAMWRKSLS